jgi:spermidine synthase
LQEGGTYAQWMPLYQVSERELSIVARTMDEVFERVTVWRGDLFSERSIVALVGHTDDAPLDPQVFVDRGRDLVGDELSDAALQAIGLRMYVGNVSASGVFDDAPINTDDHPYVEYEAPRTHREVRGGDATFLTGAAREALYDRLMDALPPEDDPYLRSLDDDQRGHVHAGRSYSRFRWLDASGREDEARTYLDDFLARSPEEVSGAGDVSPARRLLDPILAPVPRA